MQAKTSFLFPEDAYNLKVIFSGYLEQQATLVRDLSRAAAFEYLNWVDREKIARGASTLMVCTRHFAREFPPHDSSRDVILQDEARARA